MAERSTRGRGIAVAVVLLAALVLALLSPGWHRSTEDTALVTDATDDAPAAADCTALEAECEEAVVDILANYPGPADIRPVRRSTTMDELVARSRAIGLDEYNFDLGDPEEALAPFGALGPQESPGLIAMNLPGGTGPNSILPQSLGPLGITTSPVVMGRFAHTGGSGSGGGGGGGVSGGGGGGGAFVPNERTGGETPGNAAGGNGGSSQGDDDGGTPDGGTQPGGSSPTLPGGGPNLPGGGPVTLTQTTPIETVPGPSALALAGLGAALASLFKRRHASGA